MHHLRFSAAAGLCLAVAANAALSASLPQPLTMDQALTWAEQYNPVLHGARIEIRRREGVIEHADVAVPSNPELEIEIGDRESPDGRDTEDIGLVLSQEFWIAGQGGLREKAARSRLVSARSELEYLSAATAARVRAAFLHLLVAELAVETAAELLEVNNSLDEYARRRLKAGQATRLEVNTARIGLGRAHALLARAENRQSQASLRLAELLAVDPDRPLKVSGQLALSELVLPDTRALLRQTIQRRGDLAAAAEKVNAAQKELKLANRQWVPNLRVFAFSNKEGSEDITGGGISFELPLLHRYGGEQREAAAKLDSARLEHDNHQRVVRTQVLAALSNYRAARKRATAMSSDMVDAARQNFELTRQAFEAGELGAPALATSQATLVNTRREYLQALEDLVTAGTNLEKVTGGLIVMMNQNTAADGAVQ